MLFAYWYMRLIVLVGLGPECRRILASLTRLSIEVMRLPSALVHEILTQLQITLLTRHLIQLDQREFDLFMPGISPFLARCRAEDAIDVVRIATHHIQQDPFPGGLKVSHRRL